MSLSLPYSKLYSSASLFVLIGILRQFTPYCEGTLEDDDYG